MITFIPIHNREFDDDNFVCKTGFLKVYLRKKKIDKTQIPGALSQNLASILCLFFGTQEIFFASEHPSFQGTLAPHES